MTIKPDPFLIDDDCPELTTEQIKRMRPVKMMFSSRNNVKMTSPSLQPENREVSFKAHVTQIAK
jgi:hypothetical protein